jgi:hypothetical protein
MLTVMVAATSREMLLQRRPGVGPDLPPGHHAGTLHRTALASRLAAIRRTPEERKREEYPTAPHQGADKEVVKNSSSFHAGFTSSVIGFG